MLFVAFCILCLAGFAVKYAIDRHKGEVVRREGPVVQLGPVELPADRHYHPGHTWAKRIGPREVLVGLDAFARRFVGRIRAIEVPAPGHRLEQGRAIWRILFDGRQLEQPAPVDGEVLAVNEDLLRHPEKLRQDPYESGWVLKVRTADTESWTANLFGAELARKWVEVAIEELQRTFSPLAGTVSRDGGELAEGIARTLPEKEWRRIVERLFPVSR